MTTSATPPNSLKVITYKSLNPGPHLLLLGAVHGNEKCGTQALHHLARLLDAGTLSLQKGQVTLIPICNPEAYRLDVRFVERNLNRSLYPKPQPKAYEDFLDPLLCPHLAAADYLLDLHSYASQGGPFMFLGGHCAKETAFGRSLGVKYFVYGWQNAYENADSREDTEAQRLEAMGTTEYARQAGAKALTLECGHHHNADAPSIGLLAAINAMNTLELLETNAIPATLPSFDTHNAEPIPLNSSLSQKVSSEEQVCIRMSKVYYKEQEGQFTRPWQHLDAVTQGETLAKWADGSTLTADRDGFIVLPKDNSPVGSEWFYLGESSPFPPEDSGAQ
jgi:predicted deacylase